MDIILFIDYAGTLVFAISGVLAGVDRKFDLFGVFILGFVTAVGGGTLRDVMIGSTPVGWMHDTNYCYLVMAALPICYFFKDRILRLKRGIFLFDTIGIGLFTILGLQKTLAFGLSPLVAVMMGVVSAVFGGVIRDVLSNQAPLIFRKEVYALACLAGGISFLFLNTVFQEPLAMGCSILIVIIVRILAIWRKWSVPFSP